jgi:DNA-binding transcriptional regulator GbsR (MarR family)
LRNLRYWGNITIMTTEDELAFADSLGQHMARQYGLPPMTGRVCGWLLICDPPEQSIADLTEALHASRSAVGDALSALERWGYVRRTRRAGERADRIAIHPDVWGQTMVDTSEYAAQSAIARRGLAILRDAPPERRKRLAEYAAFADFLVERLPQLGAEWLEHRDRLRASGDLPGGS